MTFNIKRATKTQSRLRLALIGPAGSGKTYTALAIATTLKRPVCVIDTERGSASKYADLFEYDVLELDSFSPDTYVKALEEVCKRDYGTVIVDSLSHAWMGKDGALEQVDRFAKRESGNSFGAWRNVTPMHNRLVDTIIGASAHIIATMRTKTEYVIEENDRGKKVPRKIGLAPVQRDGLEYEFDVVGDLTPDNDLVIGKTRCSTLAGKVFSKPGKDVSDILNAWINAGAPMPEPAPKAPESKPAADGVSSRVEALKAAIVEAKAKGTDEAKASVIAAVKAADLPAQAMTEVRAAYAAAFTAQPQQAAS